MTSTLDVYSDPICPWCYLGKRRLETALSRTGATAGIRYLPFELNPDMPPGGMPKDVFFREHFGNPERLEATHAELCRQGALLGLDFRFERIQRIPNTRKAHRLAWLAGPTGAQPAVIEALFRANFNEGRDIGEDAVLLDIARECAMDTAEARELLSGDRYAREVAEAEEQARTLGINGVPFFVFDGKAALSGAQPVEVFERVLKGR